jgi:type IV pilus assembly protein PilN
MIKINLLPVKAAKKKEKIINQMLIGALVVILALVGIGWRYITQKQSIAAVEQQIKDTNQKIEKLRDAKKKYEELLKKREILQRQIDAITNLDRGRDWFIRVIDKITESVPHNQLWLDSIKFGGAKGKKGSTENTIVLKGRAYDRDAVAIFMGNLSIIPCDDQLPDEEKSEVCRQRNNSCRRWNEEKKNWEWDYESCRQFYKDTCSEADSCGEDIKICTQNQAEACRANINSSACKEAKQKCGEQKKKCTQFRDDCKKLHLEEYVVYNDISLSFINAKNDKSGVNVYEFELRVKATSSTK